MGREPTKKQRNIPLLFFFFLFRRDQEYIPRIPTSVLNTIIAIKK